MSNNFVYLNSWDEVTWQVDFDNCYINYCNIYNRDRKEVRDWIEISCQSTVFCWNGVSKPPIGSSCWHKILTPDEPECYLIFSSIIDNEMFLLKYTDRFNVQHYNKNFKKAYDNSRNV